MDASKYAWSAVLIQEHTIAINGKTLANQHHTTYVSGLFQGSQLNWATVSKEVYVIYMAFKKYPYIWQMLLSS